MKKSHVFSPAVADSLETRCVPSAFNPATFGFHVTHAAVTVRAATPSAVVTSPAEPHDPGTFSQGDLPPFVTLPGGTKISLNSVTVKPTSAFSPTGGVAAPSASAVVSNPPAEHAPGTFSQGDLPPFFTLPGGTKVSLNSMRLK